VISIFGAERSDHALTILVLNKATSDLTAPITLANFQSAGTAQVWQFTSADLTAIHQLPDVSVASGTVTAAYPARSITLLVLPAAATSLPVAKPVVQAVVNSASYDPHAVSPGEIVTVYGTGLAPAALTTAAVTPDGGYLTNTLNTVRVLFNGVPSPMIYTYGNQISAVVPYEMGIVSTANVQVEQQGVRSDPFPVSLLAAVPGIYTLDASGSGAAVVLNQNGTVNSAANPAHRGEVIVFYATGEGQTVTPGVDGRLALDLMPKPAATCAVTVNGADASIAYCGAAPTYTAGLLQVNATVPDGAVSGPNALVLSIGGTQSQAKVTVQVQ
jgi:uncharacterized protein (TIGR03437 family)